MGTLYWQFNDAWPGISWSSIDYFGRWKPLQFAAKRLYPDIAILYSDRHGVTIINDKFYPVEVMAIIQLITFDGVVLVNETQNVKLAANEVKQLKVNLDSFKGKENQVVLYTEVVGGRK
jgi:beta-mannosidase